MENFTPPIKERTNEQLLEIVGSPDKWNSKAVLIANNELIGRKVGSKKIEMAKYLSKKRGEIDKRILAKESYHICEFIFRPLATLVEILFSWELKKEGRLLKAKQQKTFRIVVLLIVIIVFLLGVVGFI
jgi:hypothetical protein